MYLQEEDSPEDEGCDEGQQGDKLEEAVGCDTRQTLDTRLNANIANE